MLGDFDAQRRYVEHLPFHLTHGNHRLQVCLAVRATWQRMADDAAVPTCVKVWPL